MAKEKLTKEMVKIKNKAEEYKEYHIRGYYEALANVIFSRAGEWKDAGIINAYNMYFKTEKQLISAGVPKPDVLLLRPVINYIQSMERMVLNV